MIRNCKLCQVGAGFEKELSQRQMAEKYGVGRATVQRHRKHLGDAQEAVDEAIPDSAVDDILAEYGLTRDQFDVRGMTVARGDGSYVRLVRSASTLEHVDVDPVAILNRFDRHSDVERRTGDSAFVMSLNDWQAGKAEGGGTPALVERIKGSTHRAQDRVLELREIGRDLGTLVIIGGGDLIEGCSIYPNQSVNNDLTQSEQIDVALTLILWVIDQMAPMFKEVIVLATKGNHGENRVDGQKTAARDNNDTLLFRLAQKATDRDPGLQHVEYVICEPEMEYVWTEVCGWTLGTTHGDVFGKFVPGQTKMLKAWEWWKRVATGKQRIHMDVLVTHHFHHEEKADWGGALWVQTRAQDGGSAYFEQFSGQYSEPGMLTFVMTPANRYQDEAIL